MKKAKNQKALKEVAAYQQEVNKAHAAFERVCELGKTPAVKALLEAEKAAKEPDEDTKAKKELLFNTHEQLYYCIKKLNFINLAVTSEMASEMSDDVQMGLHLLMTEIEGQLEKVNETIWELNKAA